MKVIKRDSRKEIIGIDIRWSSTSLAFEKNLKQNVPGLSFIYFEIGALILIPCH